MAGGSGGLGHASVEGGWAGMDGVAARRWKVATAGKVGTASGKEGDPIVDWVLGINSLGA